MIINQIYPPYWSFGCNLKEDKNMENLEKEFEEMLIKKGDADLILKWCQLKTEIYVSMQMIVKTFKKLEQ